MHAGKKYVAKSMTLERFGFVGLDKRCFWGMVGVEWLTPLRVTKILPGAEAPKKPVKKPTPKPKPKPKPVPKPVKKPVPKPPKKPTPPPPPPSEGVEMSKGVFRKHIKH